MYSAYKLSKQGDNIQPWHTSFPIWNQSVVPCPVLTVASWPAYRFLKRQARWSGIPISWRIFHSFFVIHIVNKAEIDVFLELSCFFHDPSDVGNLISGSSAFSKASLNIRKFMVHMLLKPGLENFKHYFTSMWDDCNCAEHLTANKSILKEINPEYSLEGLMLKLKLPILWPPEATHWKRPCWWERLSRGGEEDDRGWDGWMASSTQWTWVCANSGRWWRTGKPGALWSMVLQELDVTWRLNNRSVQGFYD